MSTNSNGEIDLFAPIQTSTIDTEEQDKTYQMLEDLFDFSQTDEGEKALGTWAINFIDDLFFARNAGEERKVLTEKQIAKVDELHTKYLVDEDY